MLRRTGFRWEGGQGERREAVASPWGLRSWVSTAFVGLDWGHSADTVKERPQDMLVDWMQAGNEKEDSGRTPQVLSLSKEVDSSAVNRC